MVTVAQSAQTTSVTIFTTSSFKMKNSRKSPRQRSSQVSENVKNRSYTLLRWLKQEHRNRTQVKLLAPNAQAPVQCALL